MSRNKMLQTQAVPFRTVPLLGFLLCIALLLLAFAGSIAYGSASVDIPTIFQSFVAFNGKSNEHEIIRSIRVPRSLIALTVGASLGVAGALMQALTKNPLAAPATMGVNAGAAFFVVVMIVFFGSASLGTFAWVSLLGAAVAGTMVYALGALGKRGMTSLKLVIAGATITALFSSLTQGLLVTRESTLDEVRFWLIGSIAGRTMTLYLQILPYLLIGLILALLLSRQITILSLGDDVAKGLGQNVGWIKLATAFIIIMLAGASVALAGPVGFVGLVVPHVARALVGINYRWVIPYSALLGATLLLSSDILARFVIHPGEVPVGAVTAVIGAPVLIWLVRRKVAKN